MSTKLGTQDMANEIFRRQKEDPEFQSRLKGLAFNLLLVGTDNPEGNDWQCAIELHDGQFVNIGLDVQPAPSELRDPVFDKDRFDAKGCTSW